MGGLRLNYYDLLGVPEDATYEEIRKSYRELAKKYHPDVNAAKNANYLFVQINDAYNILSNPLSREEYDRFNRYNHRVYSHKTYSDVEREESMKWKNRNNGREIIHHLLTISQIKADISKKHIQRQSVKSQ